jgi:dihydroorotate dehydrogenase
MPSPTGLPTWALGAGYRAVVRPALFRVGGGDAEAAHHLTLRRMAQLGERPSATRALALGMPQPSSPVEVAVTSSSEP